MALRFLYLCVATIGFLQNTIAGSLLPESNTRDAAISFLNSIDDTKQSEYWPNVKPKLFYDNLKLNLAAKESFYPGRSTNFCSYGALSYLVMENDPVGYAKFMNSLFEKGEANYNGNHFKPSKRILDAAGTLRFKGVLDIRHAEQMWYLTLADHFKGYLNIFNRRYNEGDENGFWASTNFAKYNRMVRRMCNFKSVQAVGSDLLKPAVKNMYNYLQRRLDSNYIVTLYINNRIIHRKTHDKVKFSIPTHFVILRGLNVTKTGYVMRYWDYGSETLIELPSSRLKRIIFGITTAKP